MSSVLRALGLFLGFGKALAGDRRVRRAAACAAEALEARQLLSVAQPSPTEIAQVRQEWKTFSPAFFADLEQIESLHPAFARSLARDLARYGLSVPNQQPAQISTAAATTSGARSRSLARATRHIKLDARRGHAHLIARRHIVAMPHPHPQPAARPRHGHTGIQLSPFVASDPYVTSAQYNFSVSPHQLTFTFNEPLTASSWSSAITVLDLTTGTTVAATPDPAPSSTVGTITFDLGTSYASMADANYVAVLHGSQITDGQTPAAYLNGSDGVAGHDYLFTTDQWNTASPPQADFWFEGADELRGRSVGFNDLLTLDQNYNATGAAYSQGDLNYDHSVGFADLLIDAQHYGQSVPQLGSPGAPFATDQSNSRLLLSWSAPSDSRVTAYDVYRNWQRVATNVAGTSFLDSGLTPGTTYTYSVVSKDSAGDTSYPTLPLLASSTPSGSITVQPIADQALVEGNTATVSTTFSDSGSVTTHSAIVNWGDGASGPMTMSESNNRGTVSATHQYTLRGTYFGSVTVNRTGGGSVRELFAVTVADAPLTATGAAITATQNSQFTGTVADVSDADLSAAANKLSASIQWGDGQNSPGQIVDNGNGDFSVTGTHTYASAGSFPLTVTITDIGGSTATATGVADVSPPQPNAPGGLTATAVSSQEIDLSWTADSSGYAVGYNIYRSTSPDVQPIPDDMVDFGITSLSYQDTGLAGQTTYYYVVTSVNSASQESYASNVAQATTPAAQISVWSASLPYLQEGDDFNGTVAHFSDSEIGTTAEDYTATIYWGDTNASSGEVTYDDSGNFAVDGEHSYQDTGTYQISVSITDTIDYRTQ